MKEKLEKFWKEKVEAIWKSQLESIWKGKNLNFLVIGAICLVFLCLVVGIIGGSSDEKTVTEKTGPTHIVKLSVDFEGNFLFNKYNVIFKIDGERYDSLDHGVDYDAKIEMTEGNHELTFCSSENQSVHGTVELDVESDGIEVAYRIQCESDKVNVELVSLYDPSSNNVRIDFSEDDLIGKNYQEVEKQLKELGFENIKTVSVKELDDSEDDLVDTVSEVKISNRTDYESGSVFQPSDVVIISYYALYEDIEEEITEEVPEKITEESAAEEKTSAEESEQTTDTSSSIENEISGKSFAETRDYLKNLGYTIEYTHEVTGMDFTVAMDYYTDEELSSEGWIITGVKSINGKTINLYINTEENKARIESQDNLQTTLQSNFDSAVALAALEQYGKSVYGNSFSVKMTTGRIIESAVDENTWFMKYACTYKENNTKFTKTCEGKIKGPEDNPTVYDFYVY